MTKNILKTISKHIENNSKTYNKQIKNIYIKKNPCKYLTYKD